ncbi:MAG: alanine--glyoxylate aminotransferase family protein, partial [Paracoccus sp.]|nr:alanine--glyoxylate aminotransferase family protein [Paracoccus sp. (in: a-proteobacteria)]
TQAGVTLGIGLGAADPDNALRIAHMGYANAAQLLGTLAVIEAGMTALKIPHGPGAVDAAARVIAGAD